jgi:hypothetical protein
MKPGGHGHQLSGGANVAEVEWPLADELLTLCEVRRWSLNVRTRKSKPVERAATTHQSQASVADPLPPRYLEVRAQEHRRASCAVQGAEGITRFKPTRRGCSQRLHRNTATLVTPNVPFPVQNYLKAYDDR